MSIQFQKASRKQKPFKIAITGPSGSGKTYSSLILATTLGSKVAVIDTENGSASLYADDFTFDVLEIRPPFEVKKFTDAIAAAENAGFDLVLIDSLSHVWAAEGGLLQKKEAMDQRGGNSFTHWASITKEHEALKAALLHSPLSVIATMRSKQDYTMEINDKGKQTPKKVGLAPIQRDGMEYEFDVVFDIGMDHSFTASKDRTKLFDGRIEKMSKKHAQELLTWRNGATFTSTLTKEDLLELKKIMTETLGWNGEQMKQFIEETGYSSGSEIPKDQLGMIKAKLAGIAAQEGLTEVDPGKITSHADPRIRAAQ